jgi:UDP-N-acetylmuramoylalanine--D-glutamate ligase
MKNTTFKDKRILVMGLGSFGGGVSVTKFLIERGARVTVTDLRPEAELQESLAQLEGLPIPYHLGGHVDADFTQAHTDIVVANPAVRPDNKHLVKARQESLQLTSEMNIFFTVCPAPIVGVSGSNGKSTTASMTAAVLRTGENKQAQTQYRKVWLGGNIAQENLLDSLDQIQSDDLVVLELSSFQLYDLGRIQRSPHVAILTNIAPNHLDWHGTMEKYIKAKQNIVRYQIQSDYAILNRLDSEITDWPDLTLSRIIWYPPKTPVEIPLQVPGEHNQINASAALAAGDIFGIDPDAAKHALGKYQALPHRLEFVRELDGVRYYNDSIATTPESTLAALEAFKEPKVFILGGYDKKISFSAMVHKIVTSQSVPAVVLLGEVRETLFDEIERCKQQYQKKEPQCVRAESLAQAVVLTRQLASPGSMVLLSPACASYDMFQNFQHRGDAFRQIVLKLE